MSLFAPIVACNIRGSSTRVDRAMYPETPIDCTTNSELVHGASDFIFFSNVVNRQMKTYLLRS